MHGDDQAIGNAILGNTLPGGGIEIHAWPDTAHLAIVHGSLPIGIVVLVIDLQSVEIECLPGDLLDDLEVDLSTLVEVEQQITVGDLAVPSTIQVLSDSDEMIVRIARMAEIVEEEEEEFEEFPVSVEPELVGREREEEEG